MKSQVNGVVDVIMSVLNENDIDYELGGEINVKDVLNPTMLIEIRLRVLNEFNEEKILLSEKGKLKNNTEKLMKSYVSGLVNNWVRKYKPFNNGIAYEIKNKGSRSGSGDEQVREMRKLLKTITDPDTKGKIEAAIAARIIEIKPESNVEIDASILPEHLRHLV